MRDNIEVILFDLGGVLVKLGAHPIPQHWLPEQNSFSLLDWFTSEAAIAFERRQISASAFAEMLCRELNLDVDIQQVIDEFSRWPLGFFDGATELLDRLGKHYTVAILSNTNELHWPRVTEEFNLPQHCSNLYASHEIGKIKPDDEAFTHVLASLNVAADKVLFFDDNRTNIATACKLGMHTKHVNGVQEVKDYLVVHNFIN